LSVSIIVTPKTKPPTPFGDVGGFDTSILSAGAWQEFQQQGNDGITLGDVRVLLVAEDGANHLTGSNGRVTDDHAPDKR
jgi:hypothetical protein